MKNVRLVFFRLFAWLGQSSMGRGGGYLVSCAINCQLPESRKRQVCELLMVLVSCWLSCCFYFLRFCFACRKLLKAENDRFVGCWWCWWVKDFVVVSIFFAFVCLQVMSTICFQFRRRLLATWFWLDAFLLLQLVLLRALWWTSNKEVEDKRRSC